MTNSLYNKLVKIFNKSYDNCYRKTIFICKFHFGFVIMDVLFLMTQFNFDLFTIITRLTVCKYLDSQYNILLTTQKL